MGFSPIEDTNAPEAFCDGVSSLDSTVGHQRQRMSTMEGYLPRKVAFERQSNLTICTGAIASSIEFAEDQETTRAANVRFQPAQSPSTKSFSINVKKEIVISSGAIGSPQLLMLRSGIRYEIALNLLISSLVVLGRKNTSRDMVSKLYATYPELDLNWYSQLFLILSGG